MPLFLGASLLLSVLFTSFLSGILGMAGGMILMGIMAWLLPVQQAMTLHATAQFFANGSRAVIHRRHLHKKSILYYILGLALSFILFCLVTFMPDKKIIFLILGVSPFLPALTFKKVHFDFTKPAHAVLCGMVVTFFQITSGVGGPLLDLFFQKINMTRHQIVATKAFTQSIAHITKLVYFSFIVPTPANVSGLPLWIYIAVIPVAMTGSHLAKHILNKMTDRQFSRITQYLLWSIGLVYLVKAFLLMQKVT